MKEQLDKTTTHRVAIFGIDSGDNYLRLFYWDNQWTDYDGDSRYDNRLSDHDVKP